ncbi:MAG: ComEC family competence protein [Candidatus Doudnabacteria bacterium]|nr:ComEC family competence protein [Candidatus Doudnabacteria bacterium]
MIFSASKIFLIFCIAFIFGISLGQFVNYEIMAVGAMIFVIAGTVFWNSKPVFIFAIAGVLLLAGAWRFKIDYVKNDLAPFYNATASVEGIISAEPDVRPDKIYLTLHDLSVNGQQLQSLMLVTVPKFREFEYGEKIKFQAKILEPKEYPDFSYKNYLSRFGIKATAYMPQVEVADGNYGNRVKLFLFHVKNKFVETLGQVLPEPQNSFLAGLLLGAKKSIPQELSDQFTKTGTSHMVAISGFNITIIAAAIDWLLQWLGLRKRLSFALSVVAIIIFVIMVGGSASAVRAGIMGILLLLSLNVGRLSVAANALAFTAVMMLLHNPQILAFDIGFQLSFAALIGIVYLVPLMGPYFLWLPIFIRKYFLATLAAQILTLPILLYNFGTLSLVALIPNIIILPIVPLTMLAGFVTGILGMIWIKLAWISAYVTKILLSYILGLIGFFAGLSFAAISWHINFYAMIAYYASLLTLLIWFSRRQPLQTANFAVNLPHAKEQEHEVE